MKTLKETTVVHTDGVGQVAQATIKASAKLFNFFADQIYANKYVAIWRELVSNGIDAQKINGNKTPPLITLPSILDPIAKVRDYGTGMGHEFMMTKFMAFTEASTKENSNDFIGGFGIGSKAPLSYTEQYSIKSFQNGFLRIYSIFKDESGCPSIAFLAESMTNEPDGVEVSFPVRQDDIQAFNDVVIETLQYFDPLPELDNTQLKLSPIEYDSRGSNWGINLTRVHSKLIIGGVSYPLNIHEMSYEQKIKYEKLVDFTNFALDIYLPIGSVNIALSREHVTHDDNLYQTLNDIVKNLGDELGKEILKSFESCDTLWNAKDKLRESLSSSGSYSSKSKMIQKYAQYKGQPLTQEVKRPCPKTYPMMMILHGDLNWGHGCRAMKSTLAENPKWLAWDPTASFNTNSINRIVLNDAPDKPILRVRQCVEDHSGERILFLSPTEDKIDWKQFLIDLGSPPNNMIEYLSAYDPIKVIKSNSVNQSTRPFQAYLGPRAPSRHSSPITLLPAAGGLYICMDNFNVQSSDTDIQIALLGEFDNVVYLNKTDFINSKIDKDPNWVNVEQAIEKVKEAYRSKNKRLQWAEAWYQFSGEVTHLEEWTELSKFPKSGPLAQLNALRVEFEKVNTTADSNMRKLLGIKYEAQLEKIKELQKKAKEKYKFLYQISTIPYYQRNKYLTSDFYNNLF